MVEEDDRAIIPYIRGEIVPIKVKEGEKPKKKFPCALVLGLILGALMVTLGYLGYSRFINPQAVQTDQGITQIAIQDTAVPVIEEREVTVIVSATPEPPIATPIPVIQEKIIVVTATPPPPTQAPTESPTPAITLPFEDTFDLRPRPEWQPITGNWRVVDGHLTTNPDNGLVKIVVGNTQWTDYVVDVDIWSEDWYFPIMIIVRDQGQGYIAFQTSINYSEWIKYSNGTLQTIAQTDAGIGGLNGTERYNEIYHVTVEVNKDIYTVYSNGNKLLQAQDNQFVNGRVGISYETHNYQVWFDNFKVVSLQ